VQCQSRELPLLPSEQILTRSIAQWKSQPALQLNKRPSLFLLLGKS
jgi:hypothetical protein